MPKGVNEMFSRRPEFQSGEESEREDGREGGVRRDGEVQGDHTGLGLDADR